MENSQTANLKTQDWLTNIMPFTGWLGMLDNATIRNDIFAGIAAGILILPQAIALATMAGLPPEIGLYTSIFPVFICAFFGSSWHVLSGPNTSLSVIVAMIVGAYSSVGTPDWIMFTLTLTFMAGVIQLLFGFFKLGGLFNYFSHTVMVAIVTGVGIIIIVQQIGNFFGLTVNPGEPIEDTLYTMLFRIKDANWWAASLGFLTVATGILLKKINPKLPYIIIAVIVGTFAGWLIEFLFGITNIDKLGYLSLELLPLSSPSFSPNDFYEAAEGLMMGSFMIAFLGLMQSAVIARAMAVKSGQHINIDQEVIGQGLSNVVGSFFSCYPSCGSFNRSAANIEMGGKTPLVGIISALSLAALVYFASPVIAHMPLSVMAGILFLVGIGLIKIKDIRTLLSVRGETRIAFLLVLFATVYGGLEWAVMLGIVISVILYLRTVSKPEVDVLFENEADQYIPDGIDEATVIQLSGSVFFGSTQSIEIAFADIAKEDHRLMPLIIAGEHIDNMDDAGVTTLLTEAQKRNLAGGSMILWLRNHKLDAVLERNGLIKAIGKDNMHYVA
ncbi:MAG: SulP family inorganic anion transporter [Gammaproteobacteria bacterium]